MLATRLTQHNLLLRVIVAIILLTHSIPGMLDGGVNDFGNLYLNQVGFAPVGVLVAWIVKGSHVVCAVLLLLNKYIKWAVIPTVVILIAGIIMVHGPEGWFVVGGGRNGMEYNILLICVLVVILIGSKKYR